MEVEVEGVKFSLRLCFRDKIKHEKRQERTISVEDGG